jgi:single-strand DNA-binding protein
MNKIILMGRLTRDPEVRYGSSGNAIGSFSLAVDRRFKREGQPTADFFSVVSFGKQAEFVEKYLRKGTKIVLEGEMQNDNYTDKEGKMVYGFKIIASSIEFAESKSSSDGGRQNEPQNEPQSAPDDGFMNIPDGIEDELPFS